MTNRPTKADAPAATRTGLIAIFRSIASKFGRDADAGKTAAAHSGYSTGTWTGQYAGPSSFADSIRF